MNHVVLVLATLALPAVAQTQIARFDFESQLGSAQPSFAYVGDVTLTRSHQFGGTSPDQTLSLPLGWNAGGNAWFTVWPSGGNRVDFNHLQWLVRPNLPGVADSVSAVTVFANGVQVAAINPIPQNALIDIDLTGFASLQDQTQPVSFFFAFAGNPTGQSAHEISFLQVTGVPCDFNLTSVVPSSLPTVTADDFLVLGTGLQSAQGVSAVSQVRFGGVALAPHVVGNFGPGSYEVVTQWKLRVHPPQCLPPGVYTIEVTTACDVQSVQVTMVDPTQPTIACEPTHPAGQNQKYIIHGGGPGPQILIFVASPSNKPSVVPGLLSLDIGDNFTVFGMLLLVGDCVVFDVPVPITKLGACHFYQGIVWHSSNLSLASPLPTTNVVSTCWF